MPASSAIDPPARRLDVCSSAQAAESDGNSAAKAGDALSENNLDDATDDSLWAVPDVSTSVVPAAVEEFPDWNHMSLPMDAKALLGEEFQQEMDVRPSLIPPAVRALPCCCAQARYRPARSGRALRMADRAEAPLLCLFVTPTFSLHSARAGSKTAGAGV